MRVSYGDDIYLVIIYVALLLVHKSRIEASKIAIYILQYTERPFSVLQSCAFSVLGNSALIKCNCSIQFDDFYHIRNFHCFYFSAADNYTFLNTRISNVRCPYQMV